MIDKNTASLNEVLKAKEAADRAAQDTQRAEHGEVALDDTQRVKVLSPGRLVFKRFIRNKLAIVGTAILVFMFLFAFLFPVFYPYGQTETFFKYGTLTVSYATAGERTDYANYMLDENAEIHYSIKNMLTSYISDMEKQGLTELALRSDDGLWYYLQRLGEKQYLLSAPTGIEVAQFGALQAVAEATGKLHLVKLAAGYEPAAGFEEDFQAAIKAGASSFRSAGEEFLIISSGANNYKACSFASAGMTYIGEDLGSGFQSAFVAAVLAGEEEPSFNFGGSSYEVSGSYTSGFSIRRRGANVPALLATRWVLDAYEAGTSFSEGFITAAQLALYGDRAFTFDGANYTIADSADGPVIYKDGAKIAAFSTFVVRRYSGEDTLDIAFKKAARTAIAAAEAKGQSTATFHYELPMIDENGAYLTDESGALELTDTEITASRKVAGWVLNCEQTAHLIDIYAPPSSTHPFGTDADGFDILARMMYGGRISLMVGFVVVILESLLGTVLGGIAGYFGGWVDGLIMRLVDIFYCVPTYPILIILGAYFDSVKLGSYARLGWMMAVMGFLGWAGIARLVRGQILSLREQEFMSAAEATGISTRRKIFRHLIPNVMPQLIVSATMGLGSVIITESTLSFLGLGVKHPLATWGTMINSITSSNENLIRYAHIWIPVGMLICLTVIAFNFVGDGLRDAFDPKMK